MTNTFTYTGLGFGLLILTTCVFKPSAEKHAGMEEYATAVTITNRFPLVSIPVSSLGSSYLKLNVIDQYNPSNVPMQVAARVGLGQSMKWIGRLNTSPASASSDLVLDMAPYSDRLCSGRTRNLEVGLMQLPEGKDSFSLTINIRRVQPGR